MNADWNQTSYPTPNGQRELPASERSLVLPLVMQYLVPVPVSVIALGTVSAAVMSSADSVILSSASVFAKNIYCDIIRPKVCCQQITFSPSFFAPST
jgi:high affinity choline transporter 7